MNILIITEYFPETDVSGITGGVEARSYYLGRELAKEHRVTILTSWQKGQRREDTISGMNVMRCGQHHLYTNEGAIISRLRFAWSAFKIGKGLKGIDIVEGNNFISYLPAFYIAKHHGIPSVATYNEVWLGEWIKNKGLLTGVLGEIWERIVLSKDWRYFISVSNFTRKRLIESGISKEKIAVVPNGIDLQEINEVKSEKSDKPTICYIGRLAPSKRVEDLIYSIKIIKEKIPQLRCRIVGEGSEMERLKMLSLKLGIKEDIEFLGYLNNRYDVIKILKGSHIFCLPSIVEGFGIVVLEAAACGIPFVISDIEALTEITRMGKGGLIFKRMTPSDLAEKIIMLLSDSALYTKKVRETEELSECYDWKHIAIMVSNLYQKVTLLS